MANWASTSYAIEGPKELMRTLSISINLKLWINYQGGG
jgi:hypothetical protein